MHFEPTISLGAVISLLVMLFTFYKFHMSNVQRFMKIEMQVDQMWQVFKRRFGLGNDDIFGGKNNED